MRRRDSAESGAGSRLGRAIVLFAVLAAVLVAPPRAGSAERQPDDVEVALSLAELLQAARAVISRNQDLINDPNRGDKGLTGDVVLAAAIDGYRQETGIDPAELDPGSRLGRLLKAEMAAIREAVDENQAFINEKGVAFKGFIPAVFARLITERLQEKVGSDLEMKVTAPPALVRNRKSRPDEWERRIIETKFLSQDWPRGEIFYQQQPSRGRDAFRVMVPEYYAASCLECHGKPKGEVDITGYPKEGASEGDLGGVISITLFRQGE